MKTPQLEHGVYDIATGEEITTPLGLPRDPATVLVDHYIATAARMEILERLDEINQWFDKNPYWRLTDDHRDFKQRPRSRNGAVGIDKRNSEKLKVGRRCNP
jgi:hypothetical protein